MIQTATDAADGCRALLNKYCRLLDVCLVVLAQPGNCWDYSRLGLGTGRSLLLLPLPALFFDEYLPGSLWRPPRTDQIENQVQHGGAEPGTLEVQVLCFLDLNAGSGVGLSILPR